MSTEWLRPLDITNIIRYVLYTPRQWVGDQIPTNSTYSRVARRQRITSSRQDSVFYRIQFIRKLKNREKNYFIILYSNYCSEYNIRKHVIFYVILLLFFMFSIKNFFLFNNNHKYFFKNNNKLQQYHEIRFISCCQCNQPIGN